jgi:hypothetical protein
LQQLLRALLADEVPAVEESISQVAVAYSAALRIRSHVIVRCTWLLVVKLAVKVIKRANDVRVHILRCHNRSLSLHITPSQRIAADHG